MFSGRTHGMVRIGTFLVVLGAGCSETNRPLNEVSSVPDGVVRGIIRLGLAMPFGLDELTVHSRVDSVRVSEAGTFTVAYDSLALEQSIIVAHPDAGPILLARFQPSVDGLIVDARTTVEALLTADPALWGLDRESKAQILTSLETQIGGIAEGIEEHLAAERLLYLTDPGDLGLQRACANLLRKSVREAGGRSPRGGGGDPDTSLPWLEPGQPENTPPRLVNPFAASYGVRLRGYYDSSHVLTTVSTGGDATGAMGPVVPSRTPLPVPDNRYSLELCTGRLVDLNDPDPVDLLAFKVNLANICSFYAIGTLGADASEPWMVDPESLELELLAGVSEVAQAMAEADSSRFQSSIVSVVGLNLDHLLPRAPGRFCRTLDQIAHAYIAATAGLRAGCVTSDLLRMPDRIEMWTRVEGSDAWTIDPPTEVKAALQLTASLVEGGVQVEWIDLADNEEGYLLQRLGGGIFWDYAWLGEDVERYTDQYCYAGNTYSYRVTAFNQVAFSEPSNTAEVIIPSLIDTIPPAAVVDLSLESFRPMGVHFARLQWTAPGDDGTSGTATSYDLRYSTDVMNEVRWPSATSYPNVPIPRRAGTQEYVTVSGLEAATTYYFALKALDDAGNWSAISNVIEATTLFDPNEGWSLGFEPYPRGKGLDESVNAMILFEGDLIAAGNFSVAGGVAAAHIARWDGQGWAPLGSGLDNYVRALVVHEGDLYAGGLFTQSGETPVNYVARWDGAAWVPLGTGMNRQVWALASYQGELYAGGSFFIAGDGPATGIARWNGSAWSEVGSGVDNQVFAFCHYDGSLVVGGDFGMAGGVAGTSEIARWDGQTWTALSTGMDLDYVDAFAVHEGQLYAGGQFLTAGNVPARNVARWDGASWHPLGSGVDGWVRCLAVYNGKIFAGGDFSRVGGIWFGYVARWDGIGWEPLGSGLNGVLRSMRLTDDGLYMGGRFSEAGGWPSDHIALWRE